MAVSDGGEAEVQEGGDGRSGVQITLLLRRPGTIARAASESPPGRCGIVECKARLEERCRFVGGGPAENIYRCVAERL